MWPESAENNRPLRSGLTTGCCATACCVAAAHYLLADKQKERVSVTLPRGKSVDLDIDSLVLEGESVRATTVKDAGDDPDITHGAKVFVTLAITPEKGVRFSAGAGVGTVTKKGLVLAIGEPAINLVPRQMMTQHLLSLAEKYHFIGGFNVCIGIEGGELLAQKTMNRRLGILGGLSILGTTGIVRPFSCSAYIASIHQGIDVAVANGYEHIAATTGNTSEAFIKQYYALPDTALIEMGDFVGAVFKYLKRVPVKKLSLCGGFGKLSKLANGKLDLHSKKSSIDFNYLAKIAGIGGASLQVQDKIQQANTSLEVLDICQGIGVSIGSSVCERAKEFAQQHIPSGINVEVWAVDRSGQLVGKAVSKI